MNKIANATRRRWLPKNERARRFFMQALGASTAVMHNGQLARDAIAHWTTTPIRLATIKPPPNMTPWRLLVSNEYTSRPAASGADR